jgi:SAM-dependent methyltransferase
MSNLKTPGFPRDELRKRYDVTSIDEDEWHSFEDERRRSFLNSTLPSDQLGSRYLLNAGAGVHVLNLEAWSVISVDLFSRPLSCHPVGVCASITNLPFAGTTFGAIACLGEVLGYCDPANAFEEFARILVPRGMLIFDFMSTCSSRYWFNSIYGRAADIVSVDYNGDPENIWIYDPKYIRSLLVRSGFTVCKEKGVCGWAALLQRAGLKTSVALKVAARLAMVTSNSRWSDLTIVAAQRL